MQLEKSPSAVGGEDKKGMEGRRARRYWDGDTSHHSHGIKEFHHTRIGFTSGRLLLALSDTEVAHTHIWCKIVPDPIVSWFIIFESTLMAQLRQFS